MNRLYFGTRARRRARVRRVAFWLSLLSTAAMFAGIPGTGGALEFLEAFGNTTPSSGPETTEAMTSMRRFQNRMFDARPTASPSSAPGGSVVGVIQEAAERHGLSGDYLVSIAECESGLDPEAYNSAGYHGLFQFDQTTWAQYGKGSINDPKAQAEAAASLIAAGQSSRWPVCS